MKPSLYSSIILLMLTTSWPVYANKGGGGGNSRTQQVKGTLRVIIDDLERVFGENLVVNEVNIPLSKMKSLSVGTKVEMSSTPLLDENGNPVDAKNYPDENRIEIDDSRSEKINLIAILFHELLGLVRIDDKTYELSVKLNIVRQKLSLFPKGVTVFQKAHQQWNRANFSSLEDGAEFMKRVVGCKWVRWAFSREYENDPNKWNEPSDIENGPFPYVQEISDQALSPYFKFGLSSYVALNAGPSYLENGKIVTEYTHADGSAIVTYMGRLNDILYINAEIYPLGRIMSYVDGETIHVCRPMSLSELNN